MTIAGIFALDVGQWQVTNNIWIFGDERSVIIFDAAHDAQAIVQAVNGRSVKAIVLTHGHNDHINAAVPLHEIVDAPILLHQADRMLWDVIWPESQPDKNLLSGDTLQITGHELSVIHTLGHSPGCCSFYDANLAVLFSGDTLFCGGPGATGRLYSDEPTILRSIRDHLLVLPDHTVIYTGHGDSTTIGDERPRVLSRGHELGVF